MRYLFWNTHRNKNINSIICDLIIENDISVVALAEYTAEASDLIELLNMYGVLMERIPTIGCERIHILGRQGISISPGPQTDRTSIQVIEQDTILCCVHLNSQIYSGSEDRRQIDIAQIIYDLNDLEGKLDTTNTIVVGDFNINPYDISCISARYFHGIPVYEEAIRGSRTVAGRSYQTFYNPMLETVCTARKTIRIAGDDYPAELVKSKFLKLNSSHIEFVLDCMRENTTKVRNIKQYLKAVLFNAPSTIDSYYTALVNHDLYGGE